ncbi:rotatin isoform X2 [Polistes fuscatus]|uniref:rotatin isoform X2 n=1 Tax=Polistes fuscatus TaxID=30207 RepID=UPI001CA85312|nr:rotatin isoform X2 [Polistes fuscatus]
MSSLNTITFAHVKKLAHSIDEIRARALENIISKLDLGFGCDSDAVKKELIVKLFHWFSFDNIPHPQEALDLLHRLIKGGNNNYLNAFGRSRFRNELDQLKKKLDDSWHEKIHQIEQTILNPDQEESVSDRCNYKTLDPSRISLKQSEYVTRVHNYDKYGSRDFNTDTINASNNIGTFISPLDSTLPADLTVQQDNGTLVSKTVEGGIKWLVMPWQPLVTSDKGVLGAVEEALNNTADTNLILHTCQFITNVMLQDFPAEVFLQRPAIVSVLHALLDTSINIMEPDIKCIIPAVLKTLHKLTRCLRFRIYYYYDPCVANKKQKLLTEKLDSNSYHLSEARDSPDGGIPEANYQAYQSAATSDRSESIMDNVDESVLRLQQMLIPTYCIETLKHVISQLNIPNDSTFPLKNIKYIVDLIHELVQLLLITVMPNIWICNDSMAKKMSDELKMLLTLLGDSLEYFGSYSSIDYHRITYLHLLCITVNLLSNIVPFEVANIILTKSIRNSMSIALMDASIYLMYPKLHTALQIYIQHLEDSNELATIKVFDETRVIIKSMQAAICSIKDSSRGSYSDMLKTLYASKLSLPYHKNMSIVKKAIKFLQNINRYSFNKEDHLTCTKLILNLLANGDTDIQETAYKECHNLVKSILGIEYNKEKLTWENLIFILEPSVLTEIICYGLSNENKKIREMSDEIIIYILKGKVQADETGWLKILETIIPVLPLLQCYAHSSTVIGRCITKMLDPDIFNSIHLPYIEVLKGNLRLLYSVEYDVREEASCRLIWLLGKEKDSMKKLPRLSSLHGLPLSSLCIFERPSVFKRLEGNYQRSSLLSVLEMLRDSDVDPKMRKSALVQINVMLTDISLHKLFVNENGLSLILHAFNSALVENDYKNYPDSVIPILAILKLIIANESSVRYELSTNADVYINIIRSIFLFPNNECVKADGSYILCLLLYNDYIIRMNEKHVESNVQLTISLPHIIVIKMRLPLICKSHWKTSIHRRSEISVLHGSNQTILTFVRQYWAWEWNGGWKMLWKNYDDVNDSELPEKLRIQDYEFFIFQYSCSYFYCQKQLYNIQNSTTHDGVLNALDYLIMYLKFYNMLRYEEIKDIHSLPWEQTFERFLSSHPSSKEDCDLFVNIINFLQLFIGTTKGKSSWISKMIKNMTKSWTDLFQNLEMDNQDVHQSILKLARTCAAIERNEKSDINPMHTWIHFIELVVSTLCFGNQQHFYNLAYLDWLLTCLTYLINQCDWSNHKNLLASLGNTLIEMIISFHGAGTVSFMGLSITRNSIICLNHLLYQMHENFNKNTWIAFWYEDSRSLSWLPMLWQNRDPLVRASALQLLSGLLNEMNSASKISNAIAVAPNELCYTLLQYIIIREESCIVREQACIAFSNLIKNYNSMSFQHEDSLKTNIILIYTEQVNFYYEMSILYSNIYVLPSLDFDLLNNQQQKDDKVPSIQAATSGNISLVPRTISYLYNCQDELLPFSTVDSESVDMDNYLQSIATPALVTASCTLLNNLILIGQQEVVRHVYEQSLDKYLIGSLREIPQNIDTKKDVIHYCEILEMYTSICVVLSNCIVHSNEFAAVASFTPDCIYSLFNLLHNDLYNIHMSRLISLYNKLKAEIYNFLSVLSLTDDQHFESIQTALELHGPDKALTSICTAIKDSDTELRMSAIACLTFLLTQEIQKETSGKNNISIKMILDNIIYIPRNNQSNNLQEVISNVNKLSIRSINLHSKKTNRNDETEDYTVNSDNIQMKSDNEHQCTIGAELCKVLLALFIAHNYTRSKKNRKHIENRDLIVSSLANLLCVSVEAKKVALKENLSETALMILKELYVKLNLQPFELYKNQVEREKKINPLFSDINNILILLMNFMHENLQVKETLTKDGLADVLHKLWAWIALNKNISSCALKLLATFTTKCSAASQSLTLTTVLPGAGLRKTPNTIAIIHIIIQLICKEIDKAGHLFDNNKLHFAFHVLRNAVHVHECRVSISKSNLLQFFTKIHPVTTKRVKPWPLVELYCLEFLIDFTYYEEGQICVPKAVDSLDALIHLAKCSSSPTKILAISILRNLAFNVTNRPRILSSVDIINLLHDVFKNGSLCEIRIAGSMLWSLICNNQKGKLIARTAGFSQSIQEALGRLTLLTTNNVEQEQDVVKILEYVIRLISPIENKSD